MPKTLASFCRLCLTKTSSKVPVFGGEQENVTDLLALIELSINQKSESDAAVCFDCIVTLETFLQFKEQCHVNDEFLKTIPPKETSDDSEASEEEEEQDEEEDAMECDFLEEDDGAFEARASEEEGLIEDVEPAPRTPKKKISYSSPMKKNLQAKQFEVAEVSKKTIEHDPLDITRSVRKQRAKPESSPMKNLTVPKRFLHKIPELPGPQPTEDDLPKLLDSYPDYFHFEKRRLTRYYDLVYHGQRFNSAIYNVNNSLWQCAHRKKFKCPAFLNVSNDYTKFERRNEHSHGDQKTKGDPEVLTPQQALPDLFRICWHKVEEKRAKRVAMALAIKERNRKQKALAKAESVSRKKVKNNVNNKPIPSIPEFPGPQPTEDELPKLLDSYPDYFYFERSHNTLYYDLVYYGERFNSAMFGARYTFWQCAHRKKFKCSAMVHVSNDYTQFERRYEHTHDEQEPKKSKRNPQLYTPRQALPTLFRICWHRVKEKNAKRLQMKELMTESKSNDEHELGDSYEETTAEKEVNFIEVPGDADGNNSFE